MTKPITAGSEVDSWCTKCKLDLNHRIIAMNGPKIVRVECLTCRGHHTYRRPKSAAPEPKRRSTAAARSSTTSKPRTTGPGAQRQRWEKAVLGRVDNEFVAYRINNLFRDGQLVRHKKFGDGVVVELLQDSKVMILFQDGEKKLVHGVQP